MEKVLYILFAIAMASVLPVIVWLQMRRTRDAAARAGLRPIEGTWRLTLDGFEGQATLGAWRIRYNVPIAHRAVFTVKMTTMQIGLPQPLPPSWNLQRGPLKWKHAAHWQQHQPLEGGCWLSRTFVYPPASAALFPAELQARLFGHYLWGTAGVAFNADFVEVCFVGDELENPDCVREAAAVLVLVAEYLLANSVSP